MAKSSLSICQSACKIFLEDAKVRWVIWTQKTGKSQQRNCWADHYCNSILLEKTGNQGAPKTSANDLPSPAVDRKHNFVCPNSSEKQFTH